jgi:hypothetical protein
MHTWPTRHPQLACTAPRCFHSFRIPLTISCWHDPGRLEWIAAPLAWLTPRHAPERACLWLLVVSTDPPLRNYPICSIRAVFDWAWAEDFDNNCKISYKWPRKKRRLPPKTITPPTPLPASTHKYTNLQVSASGSRMYNFNRFYTCPPKVMLPVPPVVLLI